MGFWNAKAGSKNESQESVMGCCGYGTTNEQGKKLVDIPEKYNFFITHTSLEKKAAHKWTWPSPNELHRS